MLFIIGLLLYIVGLVGGIVALVLGVAHGAYWQVAPLVGLAIGAYFFFKGLIWFLKNIGKDDVDKFTNAMKNLAFVLDQNKGSSSVSTLLTMLGSPTDEFRQTYLAWIGHRAVAEKAAVGATPH